MPLPLEHKSRKVQAALRESMDHIVLDEDHERAYANPTGDDYDADNPSRTLREATATDIDLTVKCLEKALCYLKELEDIPKDSFLASDVESIMEGLPRIIRDLKSGQYEVADTLGLIALIEHGLFDAEDRGG